MAKNKKAQQDKPERLYFLYQVHVFFGSFAAHYVYASSLKALPAPDKATILICVVMYLPLINEIF